MRIVGLAVLERARTARNGVVNPLGAHDRADRLVARREALPERHDVGDDAVLLARQEGAGPPRAAHHFVEDQQDSMAVANVADAFEIARDRWHRARGRADHGFRDKCHHCLRAQPLDFALERRRRPLAVRFRALARLGKAIFEARIDQRHVDQQGLVRFAPPLAPAGRERAERIAVIAEPTRDHAASAVIPTLEMVLPRELERRLDRFRAAAGVPDTVEVARAHARDQRRELFRGIGREKTGVDIFELGGLLAHRRKDRGMAVTEARDRRAAARVDVSPSLVVDDVNAFTPNRDRQPRQCRTMKDVPPGHCCTLTFARPASMARTGHFGVTDPNQSKRGDSFHRDPVTVWR